jgi:hypothetical protein
MMVNWSFWLNPGWRWGSPAWLTYTSIYPGRKGRIWRRAWGDRNVTHAENPSASATGQPRPPEGRGWGLCGCCHFATQLQRVGWQTSSCPRMKCLSRLTRDHSYPIKTDEMLSLGLAFLITTLSFLLKTHGWVLTPSLSFSSSPPSPLSQLNQCWWAPVMPNNDFCLVPRSFWNLWIAGNHKTDFDSRFYPRPHTDDWTSILSFLDKSSTAWPMPPVLLFAFI